MNAKSPSYRRWHYFKCANKATGQFSAEMLRIPSLAKEQDSWPTPFHQKILFCSGYFVCTACHGRRRHVEFQNYSSKTPSREELRLTAGMIIEFATHGHMLLLCPGAESFYYSSQSTAVSSWVYHVHLLSPREAEERRSCGFLDARRRSMADHRWL